MPPHTVFQLQQFIPGVPAMRIVAAWQGRVLAGVSLLKACVNPQPFGPSTVVRYIDHPEMEETATRLVAALGLSGFASFDFVIAENGGGAFLIECNPRPVSMIHLGRLFGHDLCGAFARHLGWLTETPETVALPKETVVALFPNEIKRDPESAWLRSGSEVLHDVPWDDPSSSNTAIASSCNCIPAMRPESRICYASRTAQRRPRPEAIVDFRPGGSDRLWLG